MKKISINKKKGAFSLKKFSDMLHRQIRKGYTTKSLDHFILIFKCAFKKFREDDCTIRSNAIAYSIAFSIIPLFTVLIRYANVDKTLIQSNIARFMAMYGLADSTEILLILNEILERANAIAGVGALLMIFSAANLIIQLENAFNFIFRTNYSRPLLYRLSIYISSLIVLPGVMLLASGILQTLISQLKPPELTNITANGNGALIIGSDGILREKTEKGIRKIRLMDKIDFRAPHHDIYFDLSGKKTGRRWEVNALTERSAQLETNDFDSIHKLSVDKTKIYALSRTGVLFFSEDGGKTWDFQIFRFVLKSGIQTPRMEDLELLPDGRIFILATASTNSALLIQENKQWKITIMDEIYNGIFRYENDLELPSKSEIYLTGSGKYLLSENEGQTWKKQSVTQFGRRNLKINAIFSDFSGTLLFAGSDGSLWNSAGKIFNNLRLEGRREIKGISIAKNGNGFIYGTDGLFRYTENQGETWHIPDKDIFLGKDILSHLILADGSILFSGDNESLIHIKPLSLSEKSDNTGHLFASVKVINSSGYPIIKSIFQEILFFIIIFSVVLLIFVLGYRYLPSADVDWKSAIFGGAGAAAALVIFVLLFRLWILNFPSGTLFLYGIWAVVPVGMLIILISTLIILFGLELAYVIQHPNLYLSQENNETKQISESLYLFHNAALLLSLLHHSLQKKESPLEEKDALSHFGKNRKILQKTQDVLMLHNLLAFDFEKKRYLPVQAAENIRLSDLQNLIFGASSMEQIPGPSNSYRKRMTLFQKHWLDALKKNRDDLTIADLIPLIGK